MVPLTICVALFELFFPALFRLFELNLLTNTSEPMAYSAGGFLQLVFFSYLPQLSLMLMQPFPGSFVLLQGVFAPALPVLNCYPQTEKIHIHIQ